MKPATTIDSLKRVAYPACAARCAWARRWGRDDCRNACCWKFKSVPLTSGELRKAWGKKGES